MEKKLTILLILCTSLSLQTVTAQNTSPFWSLAGNSNATAASKLGTTNAIPLKLFTNDVERVRIETNGRVGIGITTPVNILSVKSSGGTPVSSWISASSSPVFVGYGENTAGNADFNLAMASNAVNSRPVFGAKRGRGTLAAPTAVSNNDYIASFLASGYDGSAFQGSAAVDFFVDGAPSAGNVPARISFVTGSNSGNRTERLKVGSTGNFNFNDNQLVIRQSSGNIGIGTTSPTYKLYVNAGSTSGIYSNTSGSYGVVGISSSSTGYGLYGSGGYLGVYGNGSSYGLYGSSSTQTGVYGYTGGNSGGSLDNGVYGYCNSYGVGVRGYSENGSGIAGTSGNFYAGFFNGDVYSSGNYVGSDRKLKSNIADMESGMNLLNKLKPKEYEFRHDGQYKLMHLPKGKHYGLIAQELEEVLPNLIRDTKFDFSEENAKATGEGELGKTPVKPAAPKSEVIDYKAVNYTELIPIIVKAMQEQQVIIENQNQKIEQLTLLVNQLLSNNSPLSIRPTNAFLGQNSPNPPTANSTRISYSLPEGVKKAELVINDVAGRRLKQIALSSTGGFVNVNTSLMSKGVYSYSLFVDGVLADTKRMILAK